MNTHCQLTVLHSPRLREMVEMKQLTKNKTTKLWANVGRRNLLNSMKVVLLLNVVASLQKHCRWVRVIIDATMY